MNVSRLYDLGEFVDEYRFVGYDAAMDACRAWADRSGRSSTLVGDGPHRGVYLHWWHDGEEQQYSNISGMHLGGGAL